MPDTSKRPSTPDTECPTGDPYCPCPDGDPCHYQPLPPAIPPGKAYITSAEGGDRRVLRRVWMKVRGKRPPAWAPRRVAAPEDDR